jgi:hypothetical protein
MHLIPLWLKIIWTVFITIWTTVYWQYYGPQNFLWLCDLANFMITLSLWIESPLLLSSQGISIILIQLLWLIDVLGQAILGIHIIGGTEYMFNPVHPLSVRLFSLFHLATPLLTIWGMCRLGYDRRGWLVQTGIAWVILPVCFLFTDPDRNINWVWGLFGKPQTLLDPYTYFIALMLGYPLFIYLPSHLILNHIFSGRIKH